MLSKESVDGCVCVMPMERIVDLAVMLLERKIPSVIEKPLGVTRAESERLADVARQTGTPHMVSGQSSLHALFESGKILG